MLSAAGVDEMAGNGMSEKYVGNLTLLGHSQHFVVGDPQNITKHKLMKLIFK